MKTDTGLLGFEFSAEDWHAWIEDAKRKAAKSGGPISSSVDVTPGLARLLLNASKGNRSISVAVVGKLSAAMRNGDWQLSHQGIAITRSGALADGHHRLHAVIAANVAVPMLITFGISDAAFAVMDTGKLRSGADILSIRGVKNATVTAAISRAVLAITRAGINDRAITTIRVGITNRQIDEFVAGNPYIDEIATLMATCRSRNKGMNSGVGAGLLLIRAAGASAEDVGEFAGIVANGTNLPDVSHPIFRLRQLLAASQNRGFRAEDYAAWTVKAWNATIEGRPIRLLSWKEHEAFPKVAVPSAQK